MSESSTPLSGEPGERPEQGAGRRIDPASEQPAANQGKAEPVGPANVTPGMSSGTVSDASTTQSTSPDGPSTASSADDDVVDGGSQGSAQDIDRSAPRQPQRYGEAPGPIAVDNAAGHAEMTSGGRGPSGVGAIGEPEANADVGMPGTSETTGVAQGVNAPVYEGSADAYGAGVAPAERVEPVEVAEPARRTGANDASSSGAAQGEAPAPAVEQTQHDVEPGELAADQRPVTGAHRPGAPSGEVSAT